MNKSLFVTVLAGLMIGSSALSAAVYKVDVSHSNVGFKVKHMMISTVTGKFGNFSGTYELDKGHFKSLSGHIKAASIDTGIAKRDDHLRSADFFDVAKFGDISFVMTGATKEKMTGNLTIRGVTKKVTLDIDMGGVVTDPWGNQRSGFVLTGQINRKDFGLNWNKAIEAGGVVVGDEVKLIVEVEGIEE
ncbi:polyisoprenoid-binding protein [Sulfuricurvum sp. IAE1]|jgi:polyisoprenoid-binding protein YceI|uniref:YceI family protein n=1 Tax=Sulfuricurvum sp. IAE1 TaxID=2546102 RepID=UPI00104A74FD|nr:YceI family protein [Sulfuricurvum sp. IAE1]MDD3770135.1 YceI family protein [Sulfuricurvum sp.]MDX9965619.1 YceI family protein [Sulfuricurvum sp.]TDA69241.1 polyisoprenoid-binding protein [Sulfuricurvum sp. IAE1]